MTINLSKKQKIIFALVILVIFGAVSFLLTKKPKNTGEETGHLPVQAEPLAIDEMPIIKLTAKNSGRELTLYVSAKQELTNNKIEYELIYYLEDGLSRGAMGEIDLVGGEGEKDILLGTCSRDVCRYDEGVTGGEVIISLAKNNQLHSFETKFAFLTSTTPYETEKLEISTNRGSFIVLDGGGLPEMINKDKQKILAGPFVITAETGSGTVNFETKEGTLLAWNQSSWEEIEDLKDLPLGTYLLISSQQ
ncbi:MAG: hypothetical protein PHR64_01920 [Candidatus Shapirobacteria bacterium]|nr:hypothetical protein [Candidatus Shapirobacteria bacterium]MDD5074061.1 hypothetical protein [Candidatus Shapirobacteria bacterium]MDD5481685.1 hypothetical protein [Candidatus Shapirobacteria bacterium]